MPPTTRVLIALCCVGLLALGCQKSKQAQPPPASPPPPSAPEAKESPGQPQRLKWRPGMVPTAAEADMALSLGKLLFEQAKFEEAEEQLKIASAGGKSDSDPLLLRAREEIGAKVRIANAKQALDAKDFAAAERELTAIPADSVLRSMADGMLEKLEAVREKKSQEFEEKAVESVREELDKGFVPVAKPDGGAGGVQTIAGARGNQANDPDDSAEPEEPEEPSAAEE